MSQSLLQRTCVAVFFATLVTGCVVSGPSADFRADCGPKDGADWLVLPDAPVNANELRSLANQNPNFKIPADRYSDEFWFVSPDGALVLCRSDGVPAQSCTGEWWLFTRPEDGALLLDQSAWICVA
ncbi:MAG: hypothetical protein AAGH76_11815 [Pseudomonadota bacterium]